MIGAARRRVSLRAARPWRSIPRVSIRLEMLQVARLAPKVLGPEVTELVAKFLRAQQSDNGGFKDRKGVSDLYYTVFGLDALTALQQPFDVERVRLFAQSFGDGAGLDFVHLCALARCWAAIAGARAYRPPFLLTSTSIARGTPALPGATSPALL